MANLGDLHAHTTFSDGIWDLNRWAMLLEESKERLFSITDHDSLEFYETEVYKRYENQILPGVELSCQQEGRTVHLLVYGKLQELQRTTVLIKGIGAARSHRFEEMLKYLKTLSIHVRQTVMDWSPSQKTSSNLAQECYKTGLLLDRKTFYALFSGKEGARFSSYRDFPSLQKVLEELKDAPLAKIIAHPAGLLKYNKPLLEELKESGLSGLEVYHPVHKRSLRKYYKKLCKEYDLLCSGGSDFHGYHPYRSAKSGLNPQQLKVLLNGLKSREILDSHDFQAWS